MSNSWSWKCSLPSDNNYRSELNRFQDEPELRIDSRRPMTSESLFCQQQQQEKSITRIHSAGIECVTVSKKRLFSNYSLLQLQLSGHTTCKPVPLFFFFFFCGKPKAKLLILQVSLLFATSCSFTKVDDIYRGKRTVPLFQQALKQQPGPGLGREGTTQLMASVNTATTTIQWSAGSGTSRCGNWKTRP